MIETEEEVGRNHKNHKKGEREGGKERGRNEMKQADLGKLENVEGRPHPGKTAE